MMELKNIWYVIEEGKYILRKLDLSIKQGQFYSILGPNGAGKSTLLRIMAGLLEAVEGEVLFYNIPLQQYKPNKLAKKRAVLAQSHPSDTDFEVREVVLMGRYPHNNGITSGADADIALKCMKEVGIEHLAYRNIRTLSGGEKQRVHFARVLCQLDTNNSEKSILFLDEPINNLDIQYQHQILDISKRKREEGYTVVSVLHDINLAAQYSDQIILLQQGVKVAEGKPYKVLTKPLLKQVYGIDFNIIETQSKPYFIASNQTTPIHQSSKLIAL